MNLYSAISFIKSVNSDDKKTDDEKKITKMVKLGSIISGIKLNLSKAIRNWKDIMANYKNFKKSEKFRQMAYLVRDSSYDDNNVVNYPRFSINYPIDISIYADFIKELDDPDLFAMFIMSPEYSSLLKSEKLKPLFDRLDEKTRKNCVFVYDFSTKIREIGIPVVKLPNECVYDLEQVDMLNQIRYPIPNCFGLYGNRKILPVQKIISRFNALTNDIFEDIDLSGFYITGSLLPICVATNPLEENFNISYDDLEKKFIDKKYLNKYKQDYKFIAYAEYYYASRNSVGKNYKKFNSGCPIPGTSDIDILIQGSFNDLDNRAEYLHKALLKKSENIKYKKIISGTGYRYRFYGGKLIRHIELFTSFRSPINVVSNFHVAPVRMYMTGSIEKPEFQLTHSCALSLLTGVFEGSRFVSCDKKIESIQAKYISRGYADTLIKEERNRVSDILQFIPDVGGFRLTKNCRLFVKPVVRKGLVKMPINAKIDDDYMELSEFDQPANLLSLISSY